MKAAFDPGKSQLYSPGSRRSASKSQQVYEYLCEVGHFETRLTILRPLTARRFCSAYDRIWRPTWERSRRVSAGAV